MEDKEITPEQIAVEAFSKCLMTEAHLNAFTVTFMGFLKENYPEHYDKFYKSYKHNLIKSTGDVIANSVCVPPNEKPQAIIGLLAALTEKPFS